MRLAIDTAPRNIGIHMLSYLLKPLKYIYIYQHDVEKSLWLDRLIGVFYFVLMLGIVILVGFSHVPGAEYYTRTYDAPRVVLLLIGAVILAVLAAGGWICARAQHTRIWLAVGTMVLFLLQILMIRAMLFETAWDVITVWEGVRVVAAEGYSPEQFTTADYLDVYPNNRLLLVMLVIMLRFLRSIGITTSAAQYQTVIILQAVIYDVTGILLFSLVRRLSTSVRAAWTAWLIYAVWIGLSPWVLIAYTDSNGIIFPVLLIWMYDRLRSKSYIKRWAFLAVVGGIAYHIKATNGVLIIAFVIIEACHKWQWNRAVIKKACIAVLVLGIGIMGTSRVSDLLYEQVTGVSINQEANIGMIHYLKMGLNEESVGTFNEDDDWFSMCQRNRKERNQRNLELVANRVSEMGLGRVAYLYTRKTRTNYSDGSFGFALDGTDFILRDYATVPVAAGGIDDGSLSGIKAWIRRIWRPDGAYFAYYVDVAHGIWLALLVLAIPAGWLALRRSRYLPMVFTLIGCWMFVMLFESQQRYLFIFAPLYIAVAVCGARMVYQCVKTRRGQCREG